MEPDRIRNGTSHLSPSLLVHVPMGTSHRGRALYFEAPYNRL
jgi:hypothetical protein